jgi:hypothetical protein
MTAEFENFEVHSGESDLKFGDDEKVIDDEEVIKIRFSNIASATGYSGVSPASRSR